MTSLVSWPTILLSRPHHNWRVALIFYRWHFLTLNCTVGYLKGSQVLFKLRLWLWMVSKGKSIYKILNLLLLSMTECWKWFMATLWDHRCVLLHGVNTGWEDAPPHSSSPAQGSYGHDYWTCTDTIWSGGSNCESIKTSSWVLKRRTFLKQDNTYTYPCKE